METVSYILSLIATVLGLIEPFSKRMRTVLILSFIGNFLIAVSYFCVSGYSGAAICGVACIQLAINYAFTSRGKKIPIYLIIAYAAVFVCVNLLTFKEIYDIIALIASLNFVLSVAQSDAKYYRVLYIINAMLWMSYDVFAEAYGNLFTHGVIFVGTGIAILVRNKKKAEAKED